MDMICQFNKFKPPKFKGGVDPLWYQEWMWRLENLFEIMDCPARFKVAIATYQFEREKLNFGGEQLSQEGMNPK